MLERIFSTRTRFIDSRIHIQLGSFVWHSEIWLGASKLFDYHISILAQCRHHHFIPVVPFSISKFRRWNHPNWLECLLCLHTEQNHFRSLADNNLEGWILVLTISPNLLIDKKNAFSSLQRLHITLSTAQVVIFLSNFFPLHHRLLHVYCVAYSIEL